MATPTVTFPCPFCGRRMGVGTALLGKRVRCPHCKQVVLAPSAAGTAAPTPATPANPPGPHDHPTPVSPAGPPPAPPTPVRPEAVFNFPQKETAESILSEPTESEDEVFGSGPHHNRRLPELADGPQPGPPPQPSPAPEPRLPQPEAARAMPNPFAGLDALPPPAPARPAPALRPAPSAPANPWAGLDEAPPVAPVAAPPAVAPASPPAPTVQAPDVDAAPARPRADAAPPRGVPRAVLCALAGYALLATGLAVWGWFVRTGDKLPPDHPLTTIPDTFGEFEPATRKKVAQHRLLIDGELPTQLRAGLGGKVEVGQLVIEPVKVESRPLRVIADGTAGRREVELPRAVVLHLRIKNTSADLPIFPMDPAFTRLATREDRHPATCLVLGKARFWGGAIEWPFPPNVTRKYEEQQAHDATPLMPGETRDYVVFTDADPAILAAVQEAREPLLWRVQVRRGFIDFRGREVPVTALIGVEFQRAQIQNL